MLDKLQIYLKRKIGQPSAYYITCFVYLFLTFGGLSLVGLAFNCLWQVLYIGILMSILRLFTMGFHCHTNDKCFIISSITLVMFSIVSNEIPIWCVMMLCLYSCVNIYNKSPIELNEDFVEDNKDEDWHFKRVVLVMTLYLIISLLLYLFKIYSVSKCTMLSLVLTSMLLFKNDKEYI